MRFTAGVLVAAFLIPAGCRKREPLRIRVRGTVTYDGRPVGMGRIVFEPDAARGNAGPHGFAPIENGHFDTARPHCRGAVSGPTVVIIDGMDAIQGEDTAASGSRQFPRHEERIDLPQADTTRDFDVPRNVTP